MDMTRLESLESQILQLIQAYVHVKEENTRLLCHLAQGQQPVSSPPPSTEGWQSVHDELTYLRAAAQTWQHEREMIRMRLLEMMATLERLEGLAQAQELA